MASLFQPLFTDATIDGLFAAEAQVQYMLAFEAALTQAEIAGGLVPTAAGAAIGAVCQETDWPVADLAQQTLLAGNPAIPLVKLLTQRVAARDAEAAKYVHFGATSQDVLDTALMLQLQAALAHINQQVRQVQQDVAQLAAAHRATPLVGRTLLQQARPLTFGYLAAGWLDALLRAGERLHRLSTDTLAVQLGGAVGTLATLGADGPAVVAHLAEILGLPAPLLPWHSQRDRLVEVGATLALLVGGLGKMAHDLLLLMQTEVAEVAEGAILGKGGSSAMPHKRNPVRATFLVAIAGRTPALVATLLAGLPQHELGRAAGAWHAEWPVLPELLTLTAAALGHAHDLVANLEVRPNQMRHNLALTQGLIFAEDVTAALTPHLGKAAAHQLVEEASRAAPREGVSLLMYLTHKTPAAALLGEPELAALFDPGRATGLSEFFTDAVLTRFQTALAEPVA